jgi:hypothetical protein
MSPAAFVVPDPGRVVRDLVLPPSCTPPAVMKLFVLVMLCAGLLCAACLYNYWQEVDSALYTN